MAVVFISPQKKQKIFFIGITVVFLAFISLISLWVFMSQPKTPDQPLVFNKAKVNLNLDTLDTDQFKGLEHFEMMPLQFSYTAMDKKGKTVKGLVSAISVEDARSILENAGLTPGQLSEVGIGRDNPFIPYYIAAPTTTK